ncbi:MAG: chemotaxis protein CheA [Betaproteobacteria bacterium]|nr:chemotaxis protein CheA [Betaproteobacteria bacterium]
MSDFAGNEELLQDFLTEANELLADLDNRLVDLEKSPDEAALLNAVFRNFHTIKGGAGFLGATELVKLCHLTENLFDRLRNGQLALDPVLMDVILAATAEVRTMFDSLATLRQPAPAPAKLLAALESAIEGERATPAAAQAAEAVPPQSQTEKPAAKSSGPDWEALLASLACTPSPASATAPQPAPAVAAVVEIPRSASAPAVTVATAAATMDSATATKDTTAVPTDTAAATTGTTAAASAEAQPAYPSYGRRRTDDPMVDGMRAGRRESDKVVIAKDATIRIDTARLDQVLNLSGEIGLTKNRLTCLRAELMSGKSEPHTMRALDEAIGQLDLLVGDLQNAVMKTRMQPVGRLFQKYPRLMRDLARQLGKEVDLRLSGEETELDRTMIEELSDPLVHLVRNAVDHGMEPPQERRAAGKPEKGTVVLSAQQSGDHITIQICDDGRGIRAEVLRRKAIEKGLLDPETVHAMDDRQALQLVFLPGFSTKDEVSSVSGRGVGMDVVKTNIQKLNGRIDISSTPGTGTTISISLPLTLAILPVLVVRLGEQPFALPLSMVREILRLDPQQIQSVGGKASVVIRDEVLPVRSLASMLGMASVSAPAYGVLLQTAATTLVLAVDGFVGRDDVVIKPLEGVKPKGIAGATLSGDGSVVLVLDMETLFQDAPAERRSRLLALAA